MIEFIRQTNIEQLTDAHWAMLRSGHDFWSKIRLRTLVNLHPHEAEEITELLPDPKQQAHALRWICRGIGSVAKAVAKTRHDVEAGERIHAIRHEEKIIRDLTAP